MKGTRLSNILFSVCLVLLLIILGYLREIFFVHIGYQIRLNYYHEFDRYYHYTFPKWLLFLKEYSSAELVRLKWIMTIITFLLYSGITVYAISFYFKNRTYVLITLGVQAGLFALAGLCYIAGQVIGKAEAGYTLAREFMGMLQSPLVLMILLPTFIINSRQKKNTV